MLPGTPGASGSYQLAHILLDIVARAGAPTPEDSIVPSKRIEKTSAGIGSYDVSLSIVTSDLV